MGAGQFLSERDHLRPFVGRQRQERADEPQAFHLVRLVFYGIHLPNVGRPGKICNPLRTTLIRRSRFAGMGPG